jgi:8-oxo-dGTP pyrophosphatase MutT (NUDIX family)
MEQKRLSAGVVVVHRKECEWHFLVMRCFRYWDFPKGMVDAGEAPLDAALREVREESSLDTLLFNWGYEYVETPPYSGGKVARYYIAESPSEAVYLPVSEELGIPEHDEFRWLPYAGARQLLGPRVRAVLDWADGVLASEAGPAR